MSVRHRLWLMWGAMGAALGILLAVSWGPLRIAWHCYQLHLDAPREQARVVQKLDEHGVFVLSIHEGAHAGQSCTAGTSQGIYHATQKGDVLPVVYVEWKPGNCELESTIEASGLVLWSFIGALAVAVLLLAAVGLFFQRSFTRPAFPSRRMEAEPRDLRCPVCGKQMDEGYVPSLAGLHWRRLGEPIGLPHALGGLPGTVGWRGRPRLHAFRCVPCEVVALQYGDAKRG
jgi:hypothetical protein